MGDIYPRLKEYKSRLSSANKANSPLYFAKVDVQACFDTIPQKSLIRVVKTLLSTEDYLVSNEARIKPPEVTTLHKGVSNVKAAIKYTSYAAPANAMRAERADTTTGQDQILGNSVLVGPLGQHVYPRQQIEQLITEHIEFNLIKIGKKYYRQRNGIPQGSVLSSLLCNFYYGKLEKDMLAFLDRPDSALMRLIDDFLLVSTEKHVVQRFLDLMHRGLPEYGVSVKLAKSLVNFECWVDGVQVPMSEEGGFPYCGLLIDMNRLDIRKSSQLKAGTNVSDSLTVEYSTLPGRTFRRKALK